MCPPNFSVTNIKKSYNLELAICNWIQMNLSGRYFLGNNISLNEKNEIQQIYTVGFETSKELSFFMLACPYLKY
jgi:hypothetical protein